MSSPVCNPIVAGALSSAQSKHLVIDTTLKLGKVTFSQKAMIDSGATSSFINQRYVTLHHIPTTPREFPMAVKDVDGRPLATVERQVKATLVLGNHSEEIIMDVVPTGRYPIILGI